MDVAAEKLYILEGGILTHTFKMAARGIYTISLCEIACSLVIDRDFFFF